MFLYSSCATASTIASNFADGISVFNEIPYSDSTLSISAYGSQTVMFEVYSFNV